ncbi:MAG: DUF7701 domain-containing protein, partial [Gammaproteobacteria bacterium]
MAVPIPRARQCRADCPVGLRAHLRGGNCATVEPVSYLDDLAAEIERQVPGEVLPDGETRSLFRLYALLALAKGRSVD